MIANMDLLGLQSIRLLSPASWCHLKFQSVRYRPRHSRSRLAEGHLEHLNMGTFPLRTAPGHWKLKRVTESETRSAIHFRSLPFAVHQRMCNTNFHLSWTRISLSLRNHRRRPFFTAGVHPLPRHIDRVSPASSRANRFAIIVTFGFRFSGRPKRVRPRPRPDADDPEWSARR